MIRTILLLSLLSCAAASGGACGSVVRPKPETDKPVPADTVITLERTPCLGTCPSYKVTVYGDGRLVYEGREFVRVKGPASDTVTQKQLEQLLAEFDKADYFSLRDTYDDLSDGCPKHWSDNPSAYTSLQLGGRKKAISHGYGCQEKDEGGDLGGVVYPKKLYELESKIDEILNTARWVKGGAKGNPQQ